jgi:hypothetical protein
MLGHRFMPSHKAAKAQAPYGDRRRNEGLSDRRDDPSSDGGAIKKLETIKPEDHHHEEATDPSEEFLTLHNVAQDQTSQTRSDESGDSRDPGLVH